MGWIWAIGQHFSLAYHSLQVDVDNRTPLTSTDDSLDITPDSVVSATMSCVCKMLRTCPTNKLHTSLARSSKQVATPPLLSSSDLCKRCSFILMCNIAHKRSLTKLLDKCASLTFMMLKSCHIYALLSRSAFDGCRQLSWRRHTQSHRTTSIWDTGYQLEQPC
jgi:hypothetical protein